MYHNLGHPGYIRENEATDEWLVEDFTSDAEIVDTYPDYQIERLVLLMQRGERSGVTIMSVGVGKGLGGGREYPTAWAVVPKGYKFVAGAFQLGLIGGPLCGG